MEAAEAKCHRVQAPRFSVVETPIADDTAADTTGTDDGQHGQRKKHWRSADKNEDSAGDEAEGSQRRLRQHQQHGSTREHGWPGTTSRATGITGSTGDGDGLGEPSVVLEGRTHVVIVRDKTVAQIASD